MFRVNGNGRMWRRHSLRSSYDVGIIGAGGHGLATGYYLSKHGVTHVAGVDRGSGGGGAGGGETGGIVRHDAVVWGFARGADRAGIEIHPFTEVTGIDRENGQVTGVRTNQGDIRTGTVVNATAAWCSTLARMVGMELPIVTHPLQA